VATGDTYRVESRLRAADGSYRWFLMRGVPLRDAEQKVVKWFGTCTDIDDMKRNQEQVRKLNLELEERVRQRTAQLAESEQRVRRKLDSILSPDGDLGQLELADVLDIPIVQSLVERFYAVTGLPTALIDLHGRFVVAVGLQEVCTKFHRQQPEACQNCLENDMHLSAGVAAGEFRIYRCKNNLWDVATPIMVGGKHLGNLFTGQFFFADEPFNEEVFRMQARKYGFNEIEYFAALEKTPRLTREFVNESMTFLARLAQVLSQTGHSAVKLARSVEEIRRVNTELSASVKELEAFTYSASHDLRAPLRHISGFSKILMEEFGDSLPADAQHHLQRIEEGTHRMGQLVDDLLNLARVGRRDLSLQVTGLKSVVDEVIADLARDVGERHVEWKIGTLPYVECDPGLMKQVFQNLLSNALKFTRPRAQAIIEVGLAEENANNVIYVRDNGVGFSMKYADKLFGVFQRLHRPEDFEGTGVGLATVQRIIQKHGGRIWATADLDRGATFYFSLASADKAELESSAVGAGVKT
jgi:signal transduction histidine kinase